MYHPDQRYDEVLKQLEAARGEKPSGRLFDLAIKRRAVDMCADGEMSIDDLWFTIDEYEDIFLKDKELRSEGQSSEARSTLPGHREDHRAPALNRIIALEAAADQAVTEFRADNLETGLLDISEVAAWIKRIADSDGQPTRLITLPEEALDEVIAAGGTTLDDHPDLTEDTPKLRYVADKARYTHTTLIRLDGVLGKLATISQRIARRYEWEEAQTTTFILTGLPPAPREVTARKVEPWPWPKARRRIELDVPISTTPEEVADLYRRQRDGMLGNEPRSRRSLTRRSADLAVFAAEHSSEQTRDNARAIWNRQHAKTPNDQYSDPARFIRDTRAAYQRVTGEKLDWIGKRGSRRESQNGANV